ncbi:hypothetical protein FBU30_010565 [Linnemannia zychae]|nr:hypothetical protein FBU30_010565 [Linnemannia zychae]
MIHQPPLQPQLQPQMIQNTFKIKGLRRLNGKFKELDSKNRSSEKLSSNIADPNTHQHGSYSEIDGINIVQEHISIPPKNKPLSSNLRPKWKNWKGNQTCNPEQIFSPTTLQDLIDIVQLAKKNNKTIRCVGSGYSFSSCSVTDGYLVSINKMERVHGVRKLSETEIDAVANVTGQPISEVSRRESGKGTPKTRDVWAVTFESGISTRSLDKWLKKHDPPLAFTSNTVMDMARYGGLLSMGCHGAATHSRTLSDLIHELTIVDSNGDLQTLSSTDETRADEFSAACVSLGLMGIIYTYTLRVEPMDFRLQSITSLESMNDYIPLSVDLGAPPDEEVDRIAGRKLCDIVLNNDQTEIMYWVYHTGRLHPQNDKLWIKKWQRTDAPRSHTKLYEAMKNFHVRNLTKIGNNFQRIMSKIPRLTPIVAYISYKFAGEISTKVQEVPDAIHFQGKTLDIVRLTASEFAFKCDRDFVNAVRAWRYVVEQAYLYAKRGVFPVHFVEMRFLRSSSLMMSNMYDSDPESIYCAIEIIAFRGAKGFEEFSNNIGQYWMKNFNARPHWAKLWEEMDDIDQHILNTSGDQIRKFNTIRKKYDPENMFLNKTFQFIDEIN